MAERCEKIKRALRAKIRIANTIYENGDLVYFKKEGENTWRVPAKVVFQDSKVIFLRVGAIYYRVSANRIIKASDQLAEEIRNREDKRPEDDNDGSDTENSRIITRGRSQKEIDDKLNKEEISKEPHPTKDHIQQEVMTEPDNVEDVENTDNSNQADNQNTGSVNEINNGANKGRK